LHKTKPLLGPSWNSICLITVNTALNISVVNTAWRSRASHR